MSYFLSFCYAIHSNQILCDFAKKRYLSLVQMQLRDGYIITADSIIKLEFTRFWRMKLYSSFVFLLALVAFISFADVNGEKIVFQFCMDSLV